MSVTLLPDAEDIVVAFLLGQAEISDLISTRVYSAIPKDPGFPLLLVRRVAGAPRFSRPLRVDQPIIQLDAYGGTKKQARNLAATACAVIAARVSGVHDESGVVAGVVFGQFSWLPDPGYSPAKPRYVTDFTLTVRPVDSGALA